MFTQMYRERYLRFFGGKEKALTFSYDDGVKADLRLLEILNKYGLKGTFNLNSELFDCGCWHGRMDEEAVYKAFSDCGQEIALHGARHVFLSKVPLPAAIKEVADNRSYLEEKFGKIVRGMAYAYSGYNQDIKRVLADLGVAYARTTNSTYFFDVPEDWLELNPTCHHSDKRFAELAERFLTHSPAEEKKHREGWLFYVWGHSYEFDDDGNWQVIEDFCKRACKAKDVWFATNIEIYEYVTAFDRLVYSLDGERVYNPSAIPVWVEVRGKVYKIDPAKEVAFEK